jgi:hypothetical protein
MSPHSSSGGSADE